MRTLPYFNFSPGFINYLLNESEENLKPRSLRFSFKEWTFEINKQLRLLNGYITKVTISCLFPSSCPAQLVCNLSQTERALYRLQT